MTTTYTDTPTDAQQRYEALAEGFRPLFARIAEGAAQRERDRELPYEQVRWLKEANFGALRVPVEHGGFGASLQDLFGLLVELGSADSNLPQILRAHFGFVEGRLLDPDPVRRAHWLRLAGSGAVFGNAVTEIGETVVGTLQTKLRRQDAGWRLDGTKFYSTGTLYADWVTVLAEREDTGEAVFVPVPTTAKGVERIDDWDGFGQRATGSGTTVLDGVEVRDAWVLPYDGEGPTHLIAFYQLVQLAALAGIGGAVVRDGAEFVRNRKRVYSHGSGATAAEDPLVQQVVGELSAYAFGARAAVSSAVETLAAAADAAEAGDTPVELLAEAELRAYQAQVVVGELVLKGATRLFDVGGASALSTGRQLDRHWRNARTLFSHNPVIYKSRILGDAEVNGTLPPFNWLVGKPA